MKINDLVEVHNYYGVERRPVTLIGYIDRFERGAFSVDEAVSVVVLPVYADVAPCNPVTVLGDRLSPIGGSPPLGDPLNYL